MFVIVGTFLLIVLAVFVFGLIFANNKPYPLDFPREEFEEDKDTRI